MKLLLLPLFHTAVLAWSSNVSRRWQNGPSSSIFAVSSASTQQEVVLSPIVTVECKLLPEGDFVPEPLIHGVVYHESDPPQTLTFVLNRGNYLPGLHEAVAGMKVGDSIENVSLDAGWGARNPDLVATVSFQDSGVDKSQIKVGTQLFLSSGAKCVVTDVSQDNFTIDANPPMAGASYKASIKFVNLEDGPILQEYSEAPSSGKYQVATFALGCFWGGELEFMREKGVVGTAVGYTQGQVDNPTYKQVCSGTTGHTEAILVVYDSEKVSYDRLVHLAMDRLGENRYLKNQVGNDKGTQYRHGVYYHTPEQKEAAEKIIKSFGEDCVTEVLPASRFWFAEDYHQQYLVSFSVCTPR
jgi:peptide-methionine (S)-S-oxide reductase